MKDLIEKIAVEQDVIKKAYERLNELEKILIKNIIEQGKGSNVIPLEDDDDKVTVTWQYYANRLIDYDKLKKNYPEIYKQGLVASFSFAEASKTMDVKMLRQVMKDCMVKAPNYKLKYERSNKGK